MSERRTAADVKSFEFGGTCKKRARNPNPNFVLLCWLKSKCVLERRERNRMFKQEFV